MYFSEKKSENSRTALSHLKSVKYWHRPVGGLIEVLQKVKEIGVTDPTQLSGSYMELYIGSLFGIGLEKSENAKFWITKLKENPPDLAFMTMVSDERKRVLFYSREVEITRFLNNGYKNLIETILHKDNKNYPRDYVIVCFLEFNGVENLKNISDDLSKKLKNINHVFVVFHGMLLSSVEESLTKDIIGSKATIVQLVPEFNSQIIDIKECLQKANLDNEKLVYTENAQVFYGLRDGETSYPKIIE